MEVFRAYFLELWLGFLRGPKSGKFGDQVDLPGQGVELSRTRVCQMMEVKWVRDEAL